MRAFTGRHDVSITYRLIDSQGKLLANGDSIGYLKGFLGDLDPGRYTVEEVRAQPGSSEDNGQPWGAFFKLEDGTILLEPEASET
jgi:hypothetical protein